MKFSIPQEVLAQHIAILGKTGSGKTSTAKLAIEQVVAAGSRVCVLDPIKSDWWGLTSSANGKQAGLPFQILGGPRGHVPLHSGAGKAIAEIVASGALPLSIVDMAEFEAGGHARFFIDFASTLLRKMRGVVYLVVEEAHLFAPKERSGIGAENLSIHWAKTMATAGRSKGVRLVLATQRTQALHNALLGSCDTLIAHRLTAPADQEPVVKWLKANTSRDVLEQVAGSLASLKTGEAWICSGEAKLFERVQFPRISTYDNTATPTGVGETREVKTAAVDEEKLRALIGQAVEQAKADDPKELRRQLQAKDKELRDLRAVNERHANAAPAGKEKRVEVPVLKDGHLARFEKLMGGLPDRIAAALSPLTTLHDRVHGAVEPVLTVCREIVAALGKLNGNGHRPPAPGNAIPRGLASRSASATPRPAPTGRVEAGPGSSDVGKGGLRRMLVALAQRPHGLSAEQLGVRAGLSSKSGTFDTYLGRARAQSWIEGERSRLRITDAGISALGSYDPLPTGDALLAYWRGELGTGGASRMLQALAEAYPGSLTRAELGERAGLTGNSGTFDTYLGRLRRLELISGKTDLTASEELFG